MPSEIKENLKLGLALTDKKLKLSEKEKWRTVQNNYKRFVSEKEKRIKKKSTIKTNFNDWFSLV